MSDRGDKGWGSIRERNGRHQARYQYTDEQTGKRRFDSETFDTKPEAEGKLKEWLAAGKVSDAGSMTVGEYLTEWLETLGMRQLEAATMSWYRSSVERHIVPVLGRVKLAKLTATHIEKFLAEKAESGRLDGNGGLGPASVRRLQVTLSKSLNAAVRKGLLATNPVTLADKPRLPARDVTEDVWTPDHMAEFLEATKTDRLAALWRVACMTGLRRSELAGLKWGDLDLDTGALSVKRALTQVDGVPVLKSPKSAASRRIVDLDTETVTQLKRWRVAQGAERLRAGTAWESGDWCFTNEIGRPWRPDTLTCTFKRRSKAVGLPSTSISGLRHAHATALLRAGAHPKVVQERLGHSSIAVTMDVYSSVLPGMQREAVDRLATMMGG